MEDPGYNLARQAFAAVGADVIPVAVDREGMRTGELPAARLAYATPSHQFPLGSVMSAGRRRDLLAWAQRTGAYVVEDDYDGEYRFDRDPVGALQGLAPARVTYLGSASKTLAPALRLGWMVVAPELQDAVADAKAMADGGTPQIDQLALARFVERGELDRHLRRMRGRYRARRDTLLMALSEHLPRLEVEGIPAGLYVSVRLPRDVALGPLLERAWRHDVGVVGYEHGGVARLVLGYANLPEPSVVPAVRALAELVANVG
jgi:GntR family transcriptional regulator/MocR family aminotransferase